MITPLIRIVIGVCFIAILLVNLVTFSFRQEFPTRNENDFQVRILNAARDGDNVRIRELLEEGENPNRRDIYFNTPLSIAAHFGQTSTVELLIESGADINGIDGEMTPLMCAVYGQHVETAKTLIERQADLTKSDEYGQVPLSIAVRKGDVDLIKLLLESGANVEQQDERGWRPLHVALRATGIDDADRTSVVTVLLEFGADPNVDNIGGYEEDYKYDSSVGFRRSLPNKGNKPLIIAKSNGFEEIVQLLKEHGAK